MTFNVTLDIFQGANLRPEYRTTYPVDEQAPLSAMARAEQHLNVQLPEDQYAVACFAVIAFTPPKPTAPAVAA